MATGLDHDEVARYLQAAAGSDEAIVRLFFREPTERVLAVVFNELLSRLRSHRRSGRLVLSFGVEVRHVFRVFRVVLDVEEREVEVAEGTPPRPDLELVLGLDDSIDLLRALLSGDDELGRRVVVHHLVGRAWAVELVNDCFTRMKSLEELALWNGSDKWGHHWYAKHYATFFEPMRFRPNRILEIGVGSPHDPHGGGDSLRMWKQYFPRSLVFGLDIEERGSAEEQRIRTFQGDQTDRRLLAEIAENSGPFDIVIDDGSHVNSHVITTFEALFPYVRDGGFYAAEDLMTSYWPAFEGLIGEPNSTATSAGYFKALTNGLQYDETLDQGAPEPTYLERTVVGVHFFRNMVIVEKGDNDEGSIRDVVAPGVDLARPPTEPDPSARTRANGA